VFHVKTFPWEQGSHAPVTRASFSPPARPGAPTPLANPLQHLLSVSHASVRRRVGRARPSRLQERLHQLLLAVSPMREPRQPEDDDGRRQRDPEIARPRHFSQRRVIYAARGWATQDPVLCPSVLQSVSGDQCGQRQTGTEPRRTRHCEPETAVECSRALAASANAGQSPLPLAANPKIPSSAPQSFNRFRRRCGPERRPASGRRTADRDNRVVARPRLQPAPRDLRGRRPGTRPLPLRRSIRFGRRGQTAPSPRTSAEAARERRPQTATDREIARPRRFLPGAIGRETRNPSFAPQSFNPFRAARPVSAEAGPRTVWPLRHQLDAG
jgi:hypothetical protein